MCSYTSPVTHAGGMRGEDRTPGTADSLLSFPHLDSHSSAWERGVEETRAGGPEPGKSQPQLRVVCPHAGSSWGLLPPRDAQRAGLRAGHPAQPTTTTTARKMLSTHPAAPQLWPVTHRKVLLQKAFGRCARSGSQAALPDTGRVNTLWFD